MSARQKKNTYTAAEVAVLENTIQQQQVQIEKLKVCGYEVLTTLALLLNHELFSYLDRRTYSKVTVKGESCRILNAWRSTHGKSIQHLLWD